MKKARILCALLSAIMGLVLCSCEKDEQRFGGEAKYNPTPATPADTTSTPQPQKPTDPTYRQVMWKKYAAEADTTAKTAIGAQLTNDSLVTRELRFKLGMELTGPSYLVVMDPEATTYRPSPSGEKPTTTEGNWTLSGKDSVKNETCVSKFSYSYYQMSVTTVNTVGKTLIGGQWVPYMRAYLTTGYYRFSSVWEEEEIVREDSIFHREVTTNEFKVTARWDGGERSFILSKVVIIDHFIKMVEPEEPVEPTPTTVEADYYFEGLNRFLGANRVFREDTKSWSDAYLFETKDTYEIVLVNYQTNASDEKYLGEEQETVDMSTSPYSAKYNGVMYSGGNFYPAVITVDGSGWTLTGFANGKTLTQTHNDNTAVSTGIKNFTKSNTAKPSPFITTTADPSEVNGKKVIKITAKTSVHTVTKTVADASLKN